MLKEPVAKAVDVRERFLNDFGKHDGLVLNGRNESMRRLRREAIRHFERLGVPVRKNEAWKYTNISAALQHPYALHLEKEVPGIPESELDPYKIPGLDAHVVVTVNGRFSERLSSIGRLPGGAVITGLAVAAEEYVDAIEAHFARYADMQSEAFVALNTAFAHDGVFFSVPEGVVLEKPVHIIHLVKTGNDAFVQPRNLYIFGRNSQAKFIETYHSIGNAQTFGNVVTEIFVDADAVIDQYRVQQENDYASQINTTQVYQKGQSNFSTLTVTLGGKLIRNNLTIVPDDEFCETHLYGLYLGKGTQHIDNHTLVDHVKPNCFSNELYKGVLDDRSTGVFNGKVFVRRDAQKTNAFQENKSIVLTDDANMYTKPELEIYADDVKCSHGATTGSVDPEALFYLRSRGISEREARTMLLYAFAKDVVEIIKVEPLRDHLDHVIAARFNHVTAS